MARRLVIPRRLTLKGRRWRVSSTMRLPRGWTGECAPGARVIRIDRRKPRRERELTLIHEVLHALFPDGVVPSAKEERIVSALEAPIRSLFLSGAIVAVSEEIR